MVVPSLFLEQWQRLDLLSATSKGNWGRDRGWRGPIRWRDNCAENKKMLQELSVENVTDLCRTTLPSTGVIWARRGETFLPVWWLPFRWGALLVLGRGKCYVIPLVLTKICILFHIQCCLIYGCFAVTWDWQSSLLSAALLLFWYEK